MKAKGWTQSDIANEFGVTRAYISWIKRHYGGKLTPREQVLEAHYPWKIQTAHQASALYRHTRNHAEYVETGGVGMGDSELQRLRGFHDKLRRFDLVVEYDPEIPPNLDSNAGGWAFRPKTPEDGDLIIRVNEHTNLTEEGKNRIWKLPKEDDV